jgi:hypothetical protein
VLQGRHRPEPVLGRKLKNRAIEATKWRTYRAKAPAGKAGCLSKGALVRDGSHLVAPKGFSQNGPLLRRKGLRYRHIPAPSLLALSHSALNLDGAVYEFTAYTWSKEFMEAGKRQTIEHRRMQHRKLAA